MGVDDAVGFANTTGWRMRDCRTIGFRCKVDDLVGAPEDVRVADNAFARAAHSGAAAWLEKVVGQAESKHHEPGGKGCYVEPRRMMATVERYEPGLQVGNGRR